MRMRFFSQLFQPPQDQSALEKSPEQHWSLFEEGQLMIDMYERPDTLVIRSLIAGVDPDQLEISLYNGVLTVRGTRSEFEEVHHDRFFHKECYWGSFSRSVMLPVPVVEQQIRAFFKNGVVYIELPKLKPNELAS